jgi:hypothetical protein
LVWKVFWVQWVTPALIFSVASSTHRLTPANVLKRVTRDVVNLLEHVYLR